MTRRTLNYTAILFMLSLAACSGRLEKNDYVKWVRNYENRIHQQKEIGDYILDLQYQPTDYVLLQRTNGEVEKEQMEGLRAEIENIQYYILTLKIKDKDIDVIKYGANNAKEAQERLYYFSYQFQHDIYLEEDEKRLPCVLFHFERSADLQAGRTFVLGFENQNAKANTIVIDSKRLADMPIKINISKENIPALNI